MKIKLLEQVKEASKDSIVECDKITAKALITEQKAIEYTDEVQLDEHKSVVRAEADLVKKTLNKGNKMSVEINKENNEQFKIGLAVKTLANMEKKSVTGMSEGTAADGGDLVYTAVTDVMGLALEGAKLYGKTQKYVLPAGSSAVGVVIDASDPWQPGNTPVIASPGEGAQRTSTKLAFDKATVTPKKQDMYVPTTVELLEDVPALDANIRGYITGKMGPGIDQRILKGVAGTNGFIGVLDSGASAYVNTVQVTLSAPTVKQLEAMVITMPEQYADSAEWFMPRSFWTTVVGQFATYNNVFQQLVDVDNHKLMGYPVNMMQCLSATEVVFGSPKGYAVVESRQGEQFKVYDQVRAEYGETVYGLTKRMGGTPCYYKRQALDGSYVAAFAVASGI